MLTPTTIRHVLHAAVVCAWAAGCSSAPRSQPARSPAGAPRQPASLVRGPYEVGFRHVVTFDPARGYGSVAGGIGLDRAARKPARPILMGIWYPARRAARGTPMRYREYLDWSARGTPAEPVARDLATYSRVDLAETALGVPGEQLTTARAAQLEALLDTETWVQRDAEPAAGAFPLVVYRPGNRGTIEENAVLFEYLASHGYVVAAGAFLSSDGVTLGSALPSDEHAAEVYFLIGFMHRQPYVDRRRVALIGHSGGAQNMVLFAAANSAVDAVVSLDTTWDYPQNEAMFAADEALRTFKQDRARSAFALLAFAHRGASYDYSPFASLHHARRVYVTLDDLDHNDFLWQGAAGARYRDRPADAASPELIRAQYDVMCQYVGQFLDATLGGRPEAAVFLEREPVANGIQVAGVHVARAPGEPRPPTASELLELAVTTGATAAIARCAPPRRSDSEPCADDWAEKLGDSLVSRRHLVEAIAVLEADVRRRPAAVFSALRLGDAQRMRGELAAARATYAEVIRRVPVPDKPLEQLPLDQLVALAWRQSAARALAELDAAPAPPAQ